MGLAQSVAVVHSLVHPTSNISHLTASIHSKPSATGLLLLPPNPAGAGPPGGCQPLQSAMEGPSNMDMDSGPASTSQPAADPYQSPRRSRPNTPTASPAFWSPKARVTYSDRFIPSRSAAARLDFSILDREIVASEVSKSATEREASTYPGRDLVQADHCEGTAAQCLMVQQSQLSTRAHSRQPTGP